MVSSSLCPHISFLDISYSVSFVVKGQQPWGPITYSTTTGKFLFFSQPVAALGGPQIKLGEPWSQLGGSQSQLGGPWIQLGVPPSKLEKP